MVLELAGVPNASTKMLSKTNNKVVNLKATFLALQSFLNRAVRAAQQKEAFAKSKQENIINPPAKKVEKTEEAAPVAEKTT
jgi:ribosomal protein S5